METWAAEERRALSRMGNPHEWKGVGAALFALALCFAGVVVAIAGPSYDEAAQAAPVLEAAVQAEWARQGAAGGTWCVYARGHTPRAAQDAVRRASQNVGPHARFVTGADCAPGADHVLHVGPAKHKFGGTAELRGGQTARFVHVLAFDGQHWRAAAVRDMARELGQYAQRIRFGER